MIFVYKMCRHIEERRYLGYQVQKYARLPLLIQLILQHHNETYEKLETMKLSDSDIEASWEIIAFAKGG